MTRSLYFTKTTLQQAQNFSVYLVSLTGLKLKVLIFNYCKYTTVPKSWSTIFMQFDMRKIFSQKLFSFGHNIINLSLMRRTKK